MNKAPIEPPPLQGPPYATPSYAPARNMAELVALMEMLTAVLTAENGALAAMDLDTVKLLTERKASLADACAASVGNITANPTAFQTSDPDLKERMDLLSHGFNLALNDNRTRLEGTISASKSWLNNIIRQVSESRHPTIGYGPDGKPRQVR